MSQHNVFFQKAFCRRFCEPLLHFHIFFLWLNGNIFQFCLWTDINILVCHFFQSSFDFVFNISRRAVVHRICLESFFFRIKWTILVSFELAVTEHRDQFIIENNVKLVFRGSLLMELDVGAKKWAGPEERNHKVKNSGKTLLDVRVRKCYYKL